MIKYNLNDFDKIYVFVSGGIDSTYLYEKLRKFYKDKVYPVNCFNPFEKNNTLDLIKKNDKNFIEIKPKRLKLKYKDYIINSFNKIPYAIYRLKKFNQYDKKSNFNCCYYIKHKSLDCSKYLAKDNVVFINGIKSGDGKQRRIFLSQIRKGTFKYQNESSFFLRHKRTNMLYCYPFRDYTYRELPNICLKQLRKKYPKLNHSGCFFCPVLVMFDLKESERYNSSVILAKKLNVNVNIYNTKICSDNDKLIKIK
jgi:predicted phosphoadenosine phosphosulfate sulfurtransferase